ncbi:MAG: MBG domain-containing protein, partial [Burkholderiales bacterium]
VYDGSTVFAGSNLTATGVASETFAVTGAGDTTNLDSKNVQTGSTLVSLTGLALGASGNGGLAGNYTALSTTGSSVNVTARPVTLTAPSVIKTYDGGTTYTTTGADLTATGASAPLVGSDTISAATIAYANRDFGLGNKTVTLSGSTISDGNSGANYTILAQNGNLTSTINKAALTVAANPQSKVYGTIDPALTYTTGAFQFGDTAGSVLTGVLSRAAGEDVNSYAIGQNTLASNANYTVAYTGANLGITSALLNVAANPQSKLFGTPDPALTFGVTGLVNNPALGIADTAGSVLLGALTRVPGETALGGPYAITQGSLAANSNYSLGYTPNNLIITGAALVPILGVDPGQVVFVGVVNNEAYYRPGNFWHIALNPNNADPGFDVMRGTNDLNPMLAREGEGQLSGFVSRAGRRQSSCESVTGGGFCETWSFPQQRKKVSK